MASNVQDSDVRPGPNRYVSHAGVAKHVADYVTDYRNPVIITGVKSANAYSEYVGEGAFFAPVLRYDGTATRRNADELVEQIRALGDVDAIVAIGAGKLGDTAKNVAADLDVDLVIVPTLSCACAPYSACSVDYTDAHEFVGAPMHPRNSTLLLVDSALIARAPVDKMVGGIGDTLAKYYESAPVFAQADELSAFDHLSLRGAELVRDNLLSESAPALEDLRAGKYDSKHVSTLIDTIIGLAGTVGGFGGVRARESGAHAVHNALTHLKGSDATMHGEKVAYGVLVQLVCEGKNDEVARLLPFFDAVGLPHSFTQMGLEFTDENVRTVAQLVADPSTFFHMAVPDVTPEMLVDAMNRVEATYTALAA